MNLFQRGEFLLHSGRKSSFKIEADALTDGDISTLAHLISKRFRFSDVEGVPSGGLRLASALEQYRQLGHGLLIADDVLTSGMSMEEQRALRPAQGVVIFARGICPDWVVPVFDMVDFLAPYRSDIHVW